MIKQYNAMTEAEEMAAECLAIGRKVEDIKVHDDAEWTGMAPPFARFCATWGDPDLGCLNGSGATPEEAMWDLIAFSDRRTA